LIILHSISYYNAARQEKMIVYNVPGFPDIDFMKGQMAWFTGDEILLKDEFIHNFHLKPSRIFNWITKTSYDISARKNNRFFEYGNKKIVMVHTPFLNIDTSIKIPVDLMIISGKSFLDMNILLNSFTIKQVVMDGSVPQYAVKKWRPYLNQHNIPYHYVSEKGAFVFNPN